MAAQNGWSGLFESAFKASRNAMLLVDDERTIVDANGAFLRLIGHGRDNLIGTHVWHFVAHGPQASPEEWAAAIATQEFTGTTDLLTADGGTVAVQWGAHTEVVTGRRLILFVTLSTSRWGARFRRSAETDEEQVRLSAREREIVVLVADGHSGPEIADELHIAHDTVRTHIRNAMVKVGARSRAQLVAKALGAGYAFAPAPAR